MVKGSKNKDWNSLAWKSEDTARYILCTSAHSTIARAHIISRYKILAMFYFLDCQSYREIFILFCLKLMYILLNICRIMYIFVCMYMCICMNFNEKVMALKISS